MHSPCSFVGEENQVVMLGNNMCDGVLALLTFRTNHHSLKVLSSPHDSTASRNVLEYFGYVRSATVSSNSCTASGHRSRTIGYFGCTLIKCS
jgi:hypothetical protein